MKWALTDFEKISAAHAMREDEGEAEAAPCRALLIQGIIATETD